MQVIRDTYGRSFKTLRVSLLSACNLGCVYCISGDDALKESNAVAAKEHLTVPALLQIIERLHRQLDLDTIRLTGGEPLLYNGLTEVIRGIRSMGIPHIKLTTNGFLLERMAIPIREAGMEAINVSLDAIEEETFFRMSKRHSVARIIRGIDAAQQAGLSVKINTVMMKGMNDSQILPLADFAFSRGVRIRYLELMAMGHLHDHAAGLLITRDRILSVMAERYRFSPLMREGSATANYWQTEEGHVFGVIANESEPFCGDCNRLRLDSMGNIYGCLSSNHPIPLDAGEADWSGKLEEALAQKQAVRFIGSDLSMLHIGG